MTQLGFAEVTARILLTGDSQEMNCTQGFEVTSPPFDQVDADKVSEDFGTFLKAVMGMSYTYTGARIAVGNDGGDIIFDSIDGAGVGAQAAASAPQNTAYLFRKTTASGGRRNRGRMFVPGVAEGSVSSAGVVTAGDAVAYQAAADAFESAMRIGGFPLVILHPAIPAPEPKPAPAAIPEADPTPVTRLVLQPNVATQRRRLR